MANAVNNEFTAFLAGAVRLELTARGFGAEPDVFQDVVSTFQLVLERISLSGDKWLCLAKCNNRSSANAYINVFD